MAASGIVLQRVIRGIALVGFYGIVLWRIVRRNAGNRVIESGALALPIVIVMVAVMKIPSVPDWVAPGLGILFLILGFLMIFFLMQQGYNAIRRGKRNS
ncbi:MAG: hypothetical protein ABR880_17275 [Candidatus Sulfotelmatobacter sp.]|jgi:hypothetical protein